MITSFIQYLLMAPSYVNVLNVYAVCCFQLSGSIKANPHLPVCERPVRSDRRLFTRQS
jgi:hypothetical protein